MNTGMRMLFALGSLLLTALLALSAWLVSPRPAAHWLGLLAGTVGLVFLVYGFLALCQALSPEPSTPEPGAGGRPDGAA